MGCQTSQLSRLILSAFLIQTGNSQRSWMFILCLPTFLSRENSLQISHWGAVGQFWPMDMFCLGHTV